MSASLRLMPRLPRAYRQARRILIDFQPDVVLATGGYVCLPVVLAAARRAVPVVLLEQNRIPGRAIRRLASYAAVVATSFPETGAQLRARRVVCTGNPVRRAFVALAGRGTATSGHCHLLVMGGSQGARHLNEVLVAALPGLLATIPDLSVTHLTGAADHERVLASVRALALEQSPRYQALPFVTDVASRIAAAGLVLMRSGGSSLAEVACVGRPMLLVPYPHASGHQMRNAMPFVEAGAARLLPDQSLLPDTLRQAATDVLTGPAVWSRMAAASVSLGRPAAADRVAGLLAELASAPTG